MVKKDAWYNFNLLTYIETYGLLQHMFYVHLRRLRILSYEYGKFYKYLLSQLDLKCHLRLIFSFLKFSRDDLSIIVNEVLNFHTTIVLLFISSYSSVNNCFIYFKALKLSAYISKCFVFLTDCTLHHYKTSIFISCVYVLKSILSHISMAILALLDTIYLEYNLPPLLFETIFVFRAGVCLL